MNLPASYDAYKLASSPDDEPCRDWTRADDKALDAALAETKRLMQGAP